MAVTSSQQPVTSEPAPNCGPQPIDHGASVDWQQIGPRLTEPFCAPKWRVQRTSKERVQGKYPEGTRGLLVAYIDARQVFSRLDELFGPDGWQTSYRVLDAASGAIECTLTVGGISKSDVGYPNRSGGEEPLKAAYSDATKRAAVQWGIGRWLYELPSRWSEIDERGRPVDGGGRPPGLAARTGVTKTRDRRPVASGQSPAASGQKPVVSDQNRRPTPEHKPPGNGNGNGEATPKQRAFIERLCAAKGEDVTAYPAHSKQEASESIKRLMALAQPRPVAGAAPAAAA